MASMSQQQQQPVSPRAVNLAHSPLLAALAHSTPAAVPTRERDAARRRFSSVLEGSVLDSLHFAPSQLEACVALLHTLFANVVEHPEEAKYRRVCC